MFENHWNAALDEIKETVPTAQFQNWIKPVEFLRSDDKSILLGVPSTFHEQWLKSHYLEMIRETLKKLSGVEVQLQFEIFIREENEEAAKSPAEPVNATPAPAARPQLRVVPSSPEEEAGAPASNVRPNYPKHQNPFFEMPFNETAFRFCELFATGQDRLLSSLIIYSTVGMGKTHLLSHIGEKTLQRAPGTRIRYINFDAFTSEMVQSIKDNSMHEFRSRYREETDLLLFDDLHGLSGRKRTQEELLHIFNEITAKNGQIAFTTSVPIHKITDLIEPLRSRLMAAVSAEMQPPSFEDRVGLLRKVADYNKIYVQETYLRNLVDQGQNDVRELVGTLLRAHLQARLEGKELNADSPCVGIGAQPKRPQITMADIIALVEISYEIGRQDLLSKGRKSNVAWARQVCMFLARNFTQSSLGEIGRIFGRDHATVIHSFDKVKDMMKEDHQKRYEVEYLVKKLQARMPVKDPADAPFV